MANQRSTQYKRLTASVIEETEENSVASIMDAPGRSSPIPPSEADPNIVTKKQLATVFILFYVNTINYMDRFTIAGILDKIQDNFKITDSTGGLLQTAFVVSYMLFAPLFGYLGDRYPRRIIMGAGVSLWCLTTLLGSFVDHSFGTFIVLRALVGVGEASYSTIAPTIISDMFVNDLRSRMLAVFYFAIPVGSGLGYIIGSKAESIGNSWQWSLRVTPVLGLIAVLLIVFVMVDPIRGESDNSTMKSTSWTEDIKYLSKNRSFITSSIGFTCVAFVVGSLAWWGPKFISTGEKMRPDVPTTDVPNKFGLITMISGLIGVPLGSFIAQKYRKYDSSADPFICAVGLLASTPLIFFGCLAASNNTALCFALIFFGELFVNMNWSIVADMLMYVVVPTRRSTAAAFQILLSHMFGDAGSPYLIGKVSDLIKLGLARTVPNYGYKSYVSLHNTVSNGTMISLSEKDEYQWIEFYSLQYALFITCFVQVIGSFFFFMTTFYVTRDKNLATKLATGDGVDDLLNEGVQPEHFVADESMNSPNDGSFNNLI